jgi:hypothetical protein
MRQTVLIAVVATLLITSASHPAKAFSPIGIAIGAGMVGSAMQEDSYRKQKSQQSEQYQRGQSATESNSTKKNVKARNQKPKRDNSKIAKDKRDDSKIAKDSPPPKAKSPEPVASATQATPLTAGGPPTSDKFGE